MVKLSETTAIISVRSTFARRALANRARKLVRSDRGKPQSLSAFIDQAMVERAERVLANGKSEGAGTTATPSDSTN